MCSESLERVIVDFGADVSFGKIPEKINEHYGVSISISTAQQVTLKHAKNISKFKEKGIEKKQNLASPCIIGSIDGVMVPLVETNKDLDIADRRKKRTTLWGEARLSLAYAQGAVDKTYEATMGSVDEAGKQLHSCVKRSGKNHATKIHVIADGAPWIQDQVEKNFGDQANFLIDFYHVSEYLAAASKYCNPEDPKEWLKSRQNLMKEGKGEQVIVQLRKYIQSDESTGQDCPVKTCLGYLERRIHFLDYKSAIEQNLPIGSGVIESGNRHIVQNRLKLPGAWWKKENAQNMLSLRTLRANGDWNCYWSGVNQGFA